MVREVTKTPDNKLRDDTRHHVKCEYTILNYSVQRATRTLTVAVVSAVVVVVVISQIPEIRK